MAAGAVLATGAGPGVVGAGSLWAGGVQALRCAARCLSLRLLENNGSLVWCQNDKQCSTCLEPCKHPGELETGPCQSLCELLFPVWSHECLSSCALWSARRWRPSRGHVRHRPEPAALLRLAWSAVRPMPSAPGAGSAAPMAVGAPARLPGGPSETTDQRVWLPDVRPGGWYQFRVAAVNVHGTQGFTTPVRHFRSSRAPLAPLALADLRVNSTVRDADGTVAATVIWEPPEDPDVPVHHYRVSWGHATEGQWQRKLVDGHWSSVTLQRLRPGSVYTVQLQPLGADVAARPQGCPALHSCQRAPAPVQGIDRVSITWTSQEPLQ
ncbi:anosmin-1 isoform X8 [Oryctolagus cuniculus]|uniref:anosmin-1 isoform X8 n=1 Tax=Oryctolagus cuniculus TaxID=9986 RepID=UPI003879DBDC